MDIIKTSDFFFSATKENVWATVVGGPALAPLLLQTGITR